MAKDKKFTTIRVDTEVREKIEELSKGKKVKKTITVDGTPTPNDILRDKLGVDK
jgi:hypothetical protein